MALTHLQREEESQFVAKLLPKISTADLRKVRAWLADLLAPGEVPNAELIRLRGELVDREIVRRETSAARAGILRRTWGAIASEVTELRSLNALKKLPPIDGPEERTLGPGSQASTPE